MPEADPIYETNTPRPGESAEQTAARYNRPGGVVTKARDPLLQEREKTHGDFAKNAEISQRIKGVAKDHGYKDLCPIHREAFEMIALKLSRILSGQANFKDHWQDISGYALLGMEACDE